jgi:preprotein translocase subunit SecG
VNPFILLVSVLQILISIGLIVFVLLHSGKGTGLSSMLGGVMAQAGASTGIIERNLDRITIGLAIAFAVCALILAFGYQPMTTSTATAPATNNTQQIPNAPQPSNTATK